MSTCLCLLCHDTDCDPVLVAPYTPVGSTEDMFPGTWYVTHIDEMHRRTYERKPLKLAGQGQERGLQAADVQVQTLVTVTVYIVICTWNVNTVFSQDGYKLCIYITSLHLYMYWDVFIRALCRTKLLLVTHVLADIWILKVYKL